MKYTYDDAHTPPAPVALVTIRPPGGGEQQVRIKALLDTGADISVLPPALVIGLEAVEAHERRLQGLGGIDLGRVFTYIVEVLLDERGKLVECAAYGNEVILGRNWLNSFHITLDGPQETLTIKARSNARGEA